MRAGRAIATVILCGLMLRLAAQTPLRLRVVASGFSNPLDVVQDPGDPAVQFVVEQRGRIRVVRDGVVLDTEFLDVSGAVVAGGEQGLLGLAFPPDRDSPRASGLLEHTAELGGAAQIGNVSSFGLDATGELFLVSYSRGMVFKLAGPLTAPPTPLDPRILR